MYSLFPPQFRPSYIPAIKIHKRCNYINTGYKRASLYPASISFKGLHWTSDRKTLAYWFTISASKVKVLFLFVFTNGQKQQLKHATGLAKVPTRLFVNALGLCHRKEYSKPRIHQNTHLSSTSVLSTIQLPLTKINNHLSNIWHVQRLSRYAPFTLSFIYFSYLTTTVKHCS